MYQPGLAINQPSFSRSENPSTGDLLESYTHTYVPAHTYSLVELSFLRTPQISEKCPSLPFLAHIGKMGMLGCWTSYT